MEQKTEKENLQTEEENLEVSNEMKRKGFKLSVAAILIVLLAFVLITAATDFIGSVLGETAETGILILIAGLLAAVLIYDKKSK